MSNELSDSEISKLVGWVANRIPHPDFITFDDLFQEGWISALSAISSFDSSKGTKLSSWIITTVYGNLQCYISNECKKKMVPERFKNESEKKSIYVDLIQDRMDVSILVSVLKKILSPMAFRILEIQLKVFPQRVERIQLSKVLNVPLLSIDNLYGELRWAVLKVKNLM